METPTNKPVLKASEVGQFAYCSVAWHLERQGYKPESCSREGLGSLSAVKGHEGHSHDSVWPLLGTKRQPQAVSGDVTEEGT